MRRLSALLMAVAAAVAGCGPKPPPRWAEGGAALVIAPARWALGLGLGLDARRRFGFEQWLGFAVVRRGFGARRRFGVSQRN